MKYRDMKPAELVEKGDQFRRRRSRGEWVESENWRTDGKQSQSMEYRRPLPQNLESEMRSLATLMQSGDQSPTMQAKGVELQGASATISECNED